MADDAARHVEASPGGEPAWLLADRALYWPARRRLLLSDLHLGKGDAFRRAGIVLPRGGTAHDLARLAAAIAYTGATSVWILGDVLHGAVNDSAWQADWRAFRDAHAGLDLAALAGNHDRQLAGAGLGLRLLGEGVDDGPFALRHEPDDVPGLHVLAGHVHPALTVPGLGQRRWPVFWLRSRSTVLPAFSAFTGGGPMALAPRDGLVVCADGVAAWLRRPAHEPRVKRARQPG